MGEKRPISYTEKEKNGSEKGISISFNGRRQNGHFQKNRGLGNKQSMNMPYYIIGTEQNAKKLTFLRKPQYLHFFQTNQNVKE